MLKYIKYILPVNKLGIYRTGNINTDWSVSEMHICISQNCSINIGHSPGISHIAMEAIDKIC